MTIEPGKRLGPYEILSPVGAGGMGEVWQARDTRLDRLVAIKILPGHFAENEQLRARFEREAKTISSLNHPNICTLFDIGHEEGTHFIVMELIEGESLADRLRKGPLPLDQVLRFGAQIAEGLDRAHRQGITHRDLKPGNVMIAKTGAKLLDFGLARTAADAPIQGLSEMPTQAKPLTAEGSILGTLQYMAPEQLEGIETDARTDIFAFGALLYEMATGQRAFQGATRTSLIASIVSTQPQPISEITKVTPPALDHIVRKCLEKDPEERWQSAHDIASELRWISEAGSQIGAAVPGSLRRRKRWMIGAASLTVGLILGALGYRWLAPGEEPPRPPPLQYVIEYGELLDSRPRLSPDGRHIAYSHDDVIYIRELASLEPVVVPGTEGGIVPFWSPDGSWLAFAADEKLWKIRPDGSGKTLLASDGPHADAGDAVWLPSGRIIFDKGSTGLIEVSDRGGDPREVLAPGEAEADFHYVSALPDDKGFLFSVHEGDTFDNVTVWDGTDRKTLFRVPGDAIDRSVYSETGHIVFGRSGSASGVWAVPFSLDRMETTGDPFPVAPNGSVPDVVGSTLVFTPVTPQVLSEIAVVDRAGQIVRTIGEPRRGIYPSPSLSPDGTQVIATVREPSGTDLWLYDMSSGEKTRLTFHDSPGVGAPAWSPDGGEIIYGLNPFSDSIDLRAIRIDRSGSRSLGRGFGPVSFSADGNEIVYIRPMAGFNMDIWRKSPSNDDPGEPLLSEAPTWEINPALSPGGRLLAYELNANIFIRTYPDMGGPWQVTTAGGQRPRWSQDGSRLFYRLDDDMMEATITSTDSGVRIGAPTKLFSIAFAPWDRMGGWPDFAVGPDGDTFVVVRALEPIPGIVVVQNWLELVEAGR